MLGLFGVVSAQAADKCPDLAKLATRLDRLNRIQVLLRPTNMKVKGRDPIAVDFALFNAWEYAKDEPKPSSSPPLQLHFNTKQIGCEKLVIFDQDGKIARSAKILKYAKDSLVIEMPSFDSINSPYVIHVKLVGKNRMDQITPLSNFKVGGKCAGKPFDEALEVEQHSSIVWVDNEKDVSKLKAPEVAPEFKLLGERASARAKECGWRAPQPYEFPIALDGGMPAPRDSSPQMQQHMESGGTADGGTAR